MSESPKEYTRPSKTRRKRDVEALQKLGEALIELKPDQLAEIDMPETLREAVIDARDMHSRGARHRQRQYIGKLMRKVDAEPIQTALDRLAEGGQEQARHHHKCERWRSELLAVGDEGLAEFCRQHPDADVQQLRQLIRGARREHEQERPPKTFRELYRFISRAID